MPDAITRYHCPIGSCPWTLDDPGPGTEADAPLPAVELSAKPGTVADAVHEATYRALLAHALGQENVIRAHLETHSLEDWVREIMRLRQLKPPAPVFAVTLWGADDEIDDILLFSDLEAADAFADAQPDADVQDAVVLDAPPTKVTVHTVQGYVITREGVTLTPSLAGVQYFARTSWSHQTDPPPQCWSHPDRHVVATPISEPDIVWLKVCARDEDTARGVFAAEETRLRERKRDDGTPGFVERLRVRDAMDSDHD